jgi:hypothetical protein
MERLSLLIFFIIYSHMAQSTDPKIDSLKKLGREALINLAIKKVNEPAFIPDNYDRITVKASKTSLLVDFEPSILFTAKKSCYFDKITVALAGNGSGRSIKGDCEEPSYYNPSQSEKDKIDFVFRSINASDEIGHIPGNKLVSGTIMSISEHSTYFYVEVSDWSTYSHYKVNRASGKISEANHKHYDRSSEPADEFEIIDY